MARAQFPIQGNISILGTGISSGELDASSVGSSELVDYSVIESKVATGAVTSSKLGSNSVISGKIANLAVTENKINTGAVSNGKLGSRSISTTKIQTGAITNNEVNDLNASKINAGQLALAHGGTGQDLSGKTVAVLEDAQTFTADQQISSDAAFLFTRDDLVIASGVVSIVSNYSRVDTESSAATDDLDTINDFENMFMVFQSISSARDTTFKDETGNMALAGDFTLTNARDTITLQGQPTSLILEVSRSDNS